MVFFCEVGNCPAHSRKAADLKRHPWMAGISWHKFPKEATDQKRWIKLLRRKDTVKLTRRSRICSRHFYPHQLGHEGFPPTADPTRFEWNNWGEPANPRALSSHEKRPSTSEIELDYHPVGSTFPTDSEMHKSHEASSEAATVPEVSQVETVGQMSQACGGLGNWVGRLKPFEKHTLEAQPHGHDYIWTASVPQPEPEPEPPKQRLVHSVAVQTDLTTRDIEELEKAASSPVHALPPQPTEPPRPGDVIVAHITDSDERVQFYTGIESVDMLTGVWDTLEEGASNLKYWKGPAMTSSEEKKYERKGWQKPGPKRTLPPFYECLMTLMRIRLDLPLLILADLFSVSAGRVTEITITWISYMHQTLYPALVVWPSQHQVRSRMPLGFKKSFPFTRVVIDCSEFYIDKPANKDEQYKTYSQYKSHNTYKCLIGVSPNGAFTFVSEFWSGNVSDKFITEQSGLLTLIEEGDQVMADRGFHIEDLLLESGATLVAPPFTRKTADQKGKGKRLNVSEIRKTREIAKLRIHVERAIQRIKLFRILQHTISQPLQDVASMLVQVVAALCNLKGPLFYSKDEQQMRLQSKKRKKPVKRLKHTT